MSEKEFYKLFKPQLTPKKCWNSEFLEEHIFLMEVLKEFPKSWFVKAKISKSFDVKLKSILK